MTDLKATATQIRRDIVRMVHAAQSGHPGGSLGCTDFFTALYFNAMQHNPDFHMDGIGEDIFFLSNGHISQVFYSTLARSGYFPLVELNTFRKLNSRLQGHPCMKSLPGVDMSTGSLGQGLSPGVGMAMGARLADLDFHTWVILGDGEIQEGQVWEACFTASRFELGKLTAILDYNRLPQFGWPSREGYTRERPIDDPGAKFAAFGWDTIECDGHDHESLSAAFDRAESATDRPVAIIAHTIKGRGVSFMEANHNWHAKVPTQQELDNAIAELRAYKLIGAGVA